MRNRALPKNKHSYLDIDLHQTTGSTRERQFQTVYFSRLSRGQSIGRTLHIAFCRRNVQ
jgi:hypothetical protein